MKTVSCISLSGGQGKSSVVFLLALYLAQKRNKQILVKIIRHICVDGDVTRETLIEALVEFFMAHPEAQPEILSKAKTRQSERVSAANLKRIQTMTKRLRE